MATDNEQLVLSISADVRQMQRALARMMNESERSTKAVQRHFDGVTASSLKSGSATEQASKQIARSMAASRAAAQNLSFQLNDIATQLASGASPFTVMAQQGGQVAQALNSAGGVRGALSALGGAIGGLLNPVGLLSVAMIGLTGYAVQYFAQWASGGEDANKALAEHQKLVGEVVQRWGDAVPSLKLYYEKIQQLADLEKRRQALKQQITIETEGDRRAAKNTVPDIADARFDLQKLSIDPALIRAFTAAWDELTAKMAANKHTAEDVQTVQRALSEALNGQTTPATEALSDALGSLSANITATSQRIAPYQEELGKIVLTTGQATAAAKLLTAELLGMGPAGVGAVEDIAKAIGGTLIPGFEAAIGKLGEMVRNAQSIGDQLARSPLGSLAPLVSGGGRFLNPEEFQTYKANQTKSQYQIEQARSGSGRSAAATQAEREAQAVAKLIEQLEFELRTLGMSNVEREKEVALRQAGAAATPEQKARIEELTEAIHREKEAMQASKEAADARNDSLEYLFDLGADGIMALAEKSANAEEAIKRLAIQLALAVAQAALLGSGPLAGLFNGGWGKPSLHNLPGNANGTNNWRGGLTRVNERGGEIMNLPRGTQIIPHDVSVKALRAASGSSPISVDARTTIDARGADQAAIARFEAAQRKRDAEFPARVVATIRAAQKGRVL